MNLPKPLWRLLHGPRDFRIRVADGAVHFDGAFPVVLRTDAAEFLRNDLAPRGRFSVTGCWTGAHHLRVDVSGPVTPGERQRVRNFLKITLRG